MPWYGLANVIPRTNRGVTPLAPPPCTSKANCQFNCTIEFGVWIKLNYQAKYQVKQFILE
jgi:hypothetical protein